MPDCLIVAVEGKKGHERQALAVADRLDLPARVVRIGGAERIALQPDTALVLAAGRQSIAPARRIARRPAPRPVVAVLQPVAWRPADFDLLWAPAHDTPFLHLGALPRLVTTLTAPSIVTPERLAAAGAALRAEHPTGPNIGVLVGGRSRAHRFGRGEAEDLAARLAAFGDAQEATLLLTTSPRTPPAATAVLRERLAGDRHIVHDAASAADPSAAFAAILGAADAFVVTADSIAMMSEAAITGKPLYGWRLPGGKARFDRFYDGLLAHGALRWFDGGLDRWTYPPLDAGQTLADALRPLLGLPAAPQDRT